MVEYNCTSCQNKLVIPDDRIGENVRCSQCGQVNTVPDPYYHYTANSPSANTSIKPKRQWIIGGLLALFLGGCLLYVFVQRDTWEDDNFSTIMQMKSEAQTFAANGEAEQALGVYEDIFRLVGQRQITGTTFKTVIDETRNRYDDLLNEYEKVLCTSYISLTEEADRLVSSGNFSEGIKKYKEVMQYEKVRTPKNKKLVSLLRNVSAGLARAAKLTRAKEREERSRAISDLSGVILDECNLCSDRATHILLSQLITAKDYAGIAHLALSEKVVTLSAGTRAKIIEQGIFTTKVRVTSGPHAGRYGVVWNYTIR